MPRAGTPGSAGRREYGHSPPEDHHSPLRQASAPLLPTNLGFDERSIKVEGPTLMLTPLMPTPYALMLTPCCSHPILLLDQGRGPDRDRARRHGSMVKVPSLGSA